jgi:hypothetical protein
MTQATVTSRTIAVEHIKISSKHSFEEVRQKLEGTLPKYDRNIIAALRKGDVKSAKDYEEKRANAFNRGSGRPRRRPPDCGPQTQRLAL